MFLVAPRGAALDSTTEFKEKGLSAFAPEKPLFLEYFGGQQRVSIAHDLYKANLAAIMFASVYKAPVPAVYSVSRDDPYEIAHILIRPVLQPHAGPV